LLIEALYQYPVPSKNRWVTNTLLTKVLQFTVSIRKDLGSSVRNFKALDELAKFRDGLR